MALQREQVMAALRTVNDPELFKDIVTLNLVKDVRIDGNQVGVHVELTTPACPLKDVIQRDIENALRKIGAVQEGILRRSFLRGGHYHDQVLWSILAEDWRLQRIGQPVDVVH